MSTSVTPLHLTDSATRMRPVKIQKVLIYVSASMDSLGMEGYAKVSFYFHVPSFETPFSSTHVMYLMKQFSFDCENCTFTPWHCPGRNLEYMFYLYDYFILFHQLACLPLLSRLGKFIVVTLLGDKGFAEKLLYIKNTQYSIRE